MISLMANQKRRWGFFAAGICSVVVALLLYCGTKTHAASGLTISPALLSFTLTNAEPQQEIAVSVKNNFTTPVTIEASLKGIDQQANLLVPTDSLDSGLKNVLTIKNAKETIAANKSVNLQVRVEDNKDLPPGGHYATLIIRQVTQNNKRVSIQSAISVTIFILKDEGAVRKLELTNIKASRSLISIPKSIDLTFKNTGNVHVIPRAALLVIQDDGKKQFASGVINDTSVPILPSKTITLRGNTKLTKEGWLPGKYTLRVQYRYDGSGTSEKRDITFWYIPPAYFLPILLPLPWLYYKWRTHKKKVARKRVSRLVVRPRKIGEKVVKTTHKNREK